MQVATKTLAFQDPTATTMFTQTPSANDTITEEKLNIRLGFYEGSPMIT